MNIFEILQRLQQKDVTAGESRRKSKLLTKIFYGFIFEKFMKKI